MSFKKQFTTVTLFSRLVALTLFVALPFIGFYLGVMYAQSFLSPVNVVVTGHATPVHSTKPSHR